MRTVNTAELTGEALNWAVGKADGQALQIQPPQYGISARVFVETPSGLARYRPVIDWGQAGPLLEKYKVAAGVLPDRPEVWCADDPLNREQPIMFAANPRTAICRAVVSAVSGPVVDVPEALL